VSGKTATHVSDLDREQAGERVEVALAVRVLEITAVAAHDDWHVLVAVRAHPSEVEPQVVARGLLVIEIGMVGHEATLIAAVESRP
jgi:hypothetical protein